MILVGCYSTRSYFANCRDEGRKSDDRMEY